MKVGRPSGSALANDYSAGEAAAQPFFQWSLHDLASARQKALEVSGRFDRESRQAVADMVTAPFDGGAERLAHWLDSGGLLVTTGQQPGLFGGPLYSIYKALTAIKLASELEVELELPVLPLFWIASEDHDWAEASDTWLIGVDNELSHLELPAPGPEFSDLPLHRIEAELAGVVEQIEALLPQSDFSQPALDVLRRCWQPGTTIPTAFRRTLEELLGPLGLLFVEAHEAPLKTRSAPVLAHELIHCESHERLLADRCAALTNAGYGVQVPVLEGGVNLFVEGAAGRERLYRDGGDFVLRHSGQRLTRSEIEDALAADPASVSPNVLLRPVVESAVFPTVAYVAGPGEMAYFAQLQPLFEAHGLAMPIVVPRHSVTLIEGKIRKVLDKFQLDPDALRRPFHEIAAQLARDELPDDVRMALTELRGAIGAGTHALAKSAVKAVDPTLKGPVSHVRSVAMSALEDVEKKILQALKRKNETSLSQIEKARLHLYPSGKPQERVLNVFYYLTRYGESFLLGVLDQLDTAFPPNGIPKSKP